MFYRKKYLFYSLLFLAHTLMAQQEEILNFKSIIEIQKNRKAIITEIITVSTRQLEIKHGIYRDFPVMYRNNKGQEYTIPFNVLFILKNNISEPYFIGNRGNGYKRIYIGNKDIILPANIYTYTIKYQTDRVIGFYADHDELYWNVTGNDWAFPILESSCIIKLPGEISQSSWKQLAFTGPPGSQEKEYFFRVIDDRSVLFRAARRLTPGEGFSVVLGWPKKVVVPLTEKEKWMYYYKDHESSLIWIIGLLLILFYYLTIWVFKGKDPEKGVIMPQYEPPEKMSPASIRYIEKMGFDHECIATALVNCAIKGVIQIKYEKGTYTLMQIKEMLNDLSDEEKILIKALFNSNKEIKLENKNHLTFNSAIDKVKNYLKKNYLKKYFYKNSLYLIPGIIISIITLILAFISSFDVPNVEKNFISIFMIFWLSIWTTGVFFMGKTILQSWKTYFADRSLVNLAGALPITLFSIPFLIGEIVGLIVLLVFSSYLIILYLLSMIGLNILFYYLLKAPTIIGRKLMDKIEGFRLFLQRTDKEKFNRLYKPDQTIEFYERYLPYALALNIENQWTEQFVSLLSGSTVKSDINYRPGWYIGSYTSLHHLSSSFNSSFSSAIGSSSAAPGSSGSGFSGGSSGGGCGGGGGGGW